MLKELDMRISQIAGSFILGTSVFIGSQGISSEDKSDSTKQIKDIPQNKINIPKKEVIFEELFKRVEDLKPGSKERTDILEFLKSTAISQAKSLQKSAIGLRLVEILNKKKEVENWKELTPIIFSIIKEQAIVNGKILSKEKNGEIKSIETDKAVGESLSKAFLDTLSDKKSSKDLKEEALSGFSTLINTPFSYKEPFFLYEKEKLKSLSELPANRLHEIKEGCDNLIEIHQRFAGGPPKSLQIVVVPYFKKLIQENLSLINGDDKKLAIAADNLNSLSQLFFHLDPWWDKDRYDMSNAVKAYELCNPFFKDVLWKNEASSPNRIELLVKTSEALLHLSWTDLNKNAITMESNKLYVNWLVKQTDNSMKDRSKDNLERQKVIEYAIRNEIANHRIVPTLRGEQFKILIDKYTELANHNISNKEFLSNALGTFTYLRDYTYSYYSELSDKRKKDLEDASLSLFYLACSGIEKLPDSTNKKRLKADLLNTPAFIDNVDKDKLDKCLDYLSNILCKKNSNNSEEFMQIVRSLLDISHTETPETTWSPYLLHNFMAKNFDYFEKNTLRIIDTCKNTKDTNLKTKSLNEITELYLFFHQVHRIGRWAYLSKMTPAGYSKTRGSIDINPPELQSIYKKTNNLFIEKLDKLLIEIILSDLVSDSIKTKDDKKWREFYKKLEKIESYSPPITSQNRKEVILQSLKSINPHLQKLDLAALELLVAPGSESPILTNILKDAISKETSPQALQNIGKVISYGTLHNSNLRKEFHFFQGLHYREKRQELDPSEITLFQNLMLDLVRIIGGDIEVSKSYLPDYSFKADKDGKINLKDFDALMRLRRNAFLTLSYLAQEHSEYISKPLVRIYRDTAIDILEKRLERYDRPENIIKTWGEEVGVLVNAYSNMHEMLSENTIHTKSKIDFLKKRFFDGVEKTYETEGEKKTSITIPLFNFYLENEFIKLNPKENRKVLDEIYRTPKFGDEVREAMFKEAPGLQRKYIEARREFGVAFLKVLSTQKDINIREHLRYLIELGFRSDEIRDVLEAFENTKN